MKKPILYDGQSEIDLPFKWKICPRCDGHGKSSAYLGAFSAERMDELGPEFLEDYVAGFYDRPCEHCEGTGKIAVADFAKMTPEERKAYRKQEAEDAADRATERAERLFEGGWREEGWFE